MSEMTLITKQYDDIASFTSKVNRSVMVFKKNSLLSNPANKKKYPGLEITETELQGAKDDLLQSLSDLETLASETQYNSKLAGLSESPALQKLIHRSDTDRKEIEQIVQSLKENIPLSRTQFVMLDKIIAILDSERNLLFRKLRTARG